MLVTELRQGQEIRIGEAVVTVDHCSSGKVRLVIDAPLSVEIKHAHKDCGRKLEHDA